MKLIPLAQLSVHELSYALKGDIAIVRARSAEDITHLYRAIGSHNRFVLASPEFALHTFICNDDSEALRIAQHWLDEHIPTRRRSA